MLLLLLLLISARLLLLQIYMGRICTEQALSMLGHYFGEVPEATKAQLRAVFVDEALSPAELETMVRGEGGKSPRGRRPALSRADLEDGDHVSD